MVEPTPQFPATSDADTTQLVWRVLTSPTTFMVLCVLGAAILLAGALVPQGADAETLLVRYPYALAELILLLGIDDAVTSWPLLLVALLLALNLVGLRLASSRRPAGAKGRGITVEGGAVVIVGCLTVLAGVGVARSSDALDGRVIQTTHQGEAPELMAADRNVVAETRAGDAWLKRVLPFDLACFDPDPADIARRYRCVITDDAGSRQVVLAPGHSATADGMKLTLESTRPGMLERDRAFSFLVSGADAPQRVVIESTSTVGVESLGMQLTAVPGADGPLLVVEKAGATPVLMAPGVLAAEPVHALTIESLPRQRLTVTISNAPGRYLLWAGGALIALGLLVIAIKPAPRGMRS